MAKPKKNVETETENENTEPATEAPRANEPEMLVVPIGEVWADWNRNPRGRGVLPSNDDPEAFADLVKNIRTADGLLQPPMTVREDGPEGQKYRVIAGYRRYEACVALSAAPETKAHFAKMPISIRKNTVVAMGSDHVGADGETTEFVRRDVSGRLGELVLAASENSARQDVSVWDRAAMALNFTNEGLEIDEICAVLGEKGVSLSPNQVRLYQKLGSLSSKLRKRLEKLGGAGYKLGVQIVTKEFNQQQFPKIKWDTEKQTAHVDAYLAKVAKEAAEKGEEGADGKKKKREKKAKYAVAAGDLTARLNEIKELAGVDVFATLEFLLGQITREDLVSATDEAYAAALSGEGASDPDEGWEDALPLSRTRRLNVETPASALLAGVFFFYRPSSVTASKTATQAKLRRQAPRSTRRCLRAS